VPRSLSLRQSVARLGPLEVAELWLATKFDATGLCGGLAPLALLMMRWVLIQLGEAYARMREDV
jgi:hypothetical protein